MILLGQLLSFAATVAVDERGLLWETAPFDPTVDASSVREIHVVSSNHLDIGFNSRACVWLNAASHAPIIA